MRLYPRMLYRVGKLSDCTAYQHAPGIYWSLAIDEAEEQAMVEKYGFHLTVAEAIAEQRGEKPAKALQVEPEPQIPAAATDAEPEPPKRRGRPPKVRPE